MYCTFYHLCRAQVAGFRLIPGSTKLIYSWSKDSDYLFESCVPLWSIPQRDTTLTNIVIQKQTITCWLRHHLSATLPAYRDHYRVFPFPVHSLANRCRPECDGTPMRMLQRNRGNQHQEGSHQPVLPCRFLTSADLAAIFKISKIILGNPSLVIKDLY